MKEEDKRIECRPELAGRLKEAMDFALTVYSADIRKAYYGLLAKAYETEDKEKHDFVKAAAECFDGTYSGTDRFYKDFDWDLVYKYRVEPFSYKNVGLFVFPVYQGIFDDMQKECMLDDLSKSERYIIKFFFEKLTAPLRNPNVVPHNGYGQCFYDESHDQRRSFERAMEDSIKYIKENCPYTIEMFEVADEPEHEH